MKIIFFDTETTGTEPKDRLCQIAWMEQGGEMRAGLFKPPFPIPAESSAVHHISNKMVADKPAFMESPEYAEIKALFEADDSIVVAHNAKFDLAMLEKEGIVPKRHICTLRVARAMDPDGKLSGYKLQYLRYALDLEVDESAAAHSADGDVLVLEKLFERLQTKLPDIEEMIRISNLPSLIKTINFGKHAGKTVAEVAKADSSYLEWLLKSKLESSPDDEDWIYTLRVSLGKLL
jgi:DNA polymerase III epsilon subunit-like protein